MAAAPMLDPTQPQPPAPSDRSRRVAREPRRWWIGAVIGLAVVLGVLAILIVVGALVLGVGITPDESGIRDLPPVEGAPDADVVMNVESIEVKGEDVDRQIVQLGSAPMMQDAVIIAGSAVHVAEVATPFEDVSIYRWSEAEASTSPSSISECVGGFSRSGGFASCGPSGLEPQVSWGNRDTVMGTANDVTLTNLPPGAAWARVSTTSGTVIASRVVDGVAHLQWQGFDRGGFADAVMVEALDADHSQIWSAPIG